MSRVYDTARWRRLRHAKLSASPLCENCLLFEIVEPATVVDHRVAIAAGGPEFPPLDGLASLCAPCHNAKTAVVDRPTLGSFKRAVRGYDAEGNPLGGEGWV